MVWGFNIGVGEIFLTSPDCGSPSLLYNRYRVSFWVVKQPVLNLNGFHPPHMSVHTFSYPQPPLHPSSCSLHTTHTHSLLLLFFILPITLYTLLHTHSLLFLLFSLFFPPYLLLYTHSSLLYSMPLPSYSSSSLTPFVGNAAE